MRLSAPWTFRRILYTLVGGAIAGQSIVDHRLWIGVAGGYFFFMGLLAMGCAGGQCRVVPAGAGDPTAVQRPETGSDDR